MILRGVMGNLTSILLKRNVRPPGLLIATYKGLYGGRPGFSSLSQEDLIRAKLVRSVAQKVNHHCYSSGRIRRVQKNWPARSPAVILPVSHPGFDLVTSRVKP